MPKCDFGPDCAVETGQMMELGVSFLRPMWLLALPLPLVCGWWLWSRVTSIGDWHRAMDSNLLEALTALGRVDSSTNRTPLIALLSFLIIVPVAMSGPSIERRDALSFRNLDAVFFVVDASPAVTENSNWPQVLTMGRFGIAALGTRPGGIIVYAGDAYVATDVTLDHRQLGQTFSLVDGGVVPDKGTRPERALMLARHRIENAGLLTADILLVTDGTGLGPATLEQVAQLADQGVRVSIIAAGDPDARMASHAKLGGGRVFGLEQADDLSRWLSVDARTRLEQADYPVLYWRDLGRYLLVIALLPLMFLFRRDTT